MADTNDTNNRKGKKVKCCVVNSCKYYRGAIDVKMFRYLLKIYIKN